MARGVPAAGRRTALAVLALVLLGLGSWQLLDLGGRPGHEVPDAAPRPDHAADPGGASAAGRPVLVAPPARVQAPAPQGDTVGPDIDTLPPPGPDEITLVGRVVDAHRTPVPGCAVTATSLGHEQRVGRSDARGRFALRIDRVVDPDIGRWGVVARRGSGEVGTLPAYPMAASRDPIDVGTIVLQQGLPLEVIVRAAGVPVHGAEVVVMAWEIQAPALFRARGMTDEAGRVTLPALLPGPHRITASADGWARATAHVGLPRAEPLVIELPTARTVDVQVVFAGGGEPVPGATLDVFEEVRGQGWGAEPAIRYEPQPAAVVTDAEGRAQLVGLAPDDEVVLRVGGPGLSPGSLFARAMRSSRIQAGVTEVVLHVPRARQVRWPLGAGEGEAPADGTVLTARRMPGDLAGPLPAAMRIDRGQVVAEGVAAGWSRFLALTPDGQVAELQVPEDGDMGAQVTFRPARRIAVRVTETGGGAATGLDVVVRMEGGQPLRDAVPLDASGSAVVEGLHGGRVEVFLTAPGDAYGGWSIGTVDLDRGDGHIETSVAAERRGLVRIRIDGVPRLPAHYEFGGVRGSITQRMEDPARGEIRFRWRPPPGADTGGFSLFAPAHLRVDGRSGRFGTPPFETLGSEGAEPDVVEIELMTGASLILHAHLPEDEAVRLGLEIWDAAAAAWQPLRTTAPAALPDSRRELVQTYAPLRTGRYRAVESATGIASAPVEVVADGPPAHVTLDVSGAGFVRGRVDVPSGYAFKDVRVRVLGLPPMRMNPATMPEGSGVSPKDGTFGVRIPGTTPVTLVPLHPLLVPAEVGGRAEVEAVRDDVVLRLVERALAVLRLDTDPGVRSGARVPVRLFDGPLDGAPAHVLQATFEGGELRFGGYPPGTWTVWIDLPRHVPLVLPGRTLRAGVTDLGRAAPSTGATLRLHVRVPEGQAVPRLSVVATKEGLPSYVRHATLGGQPAIDVVGLGPGPFRLVVRPDGRGSPGMSLDETVVIQGDETLERTIDLR